MIKRIICTLLALLVLLLFKRTFFKYQWTASADLVPIVAAAESPGSCLFFTETAQEGGFAVCDDDEADFRRAFERWGLQKIGYPISQRYMRDGFVTQAFQKAIMQWRHNGTVALVNIFDDLHQGDFDETLLATRQTPRQLPAGWDGDLSFEQVVKKRQALLDVRPALRETYFASSEPLLFYGLPTSQVEDMGNHYAIRLQRAVLQEWKEQVPWAKVGEVTIANGGDIAKELGALPADALIPLSDSPPNSAQEISSAELETASAEPSPAPTHTPSQEHTKESEMPSGGQEADHSGSSGSNESHLVGIIMGKLSYDGPLPAMKIYALNLDRDAFYVVETQAGESSYQIEVPEGTYEVVAYPIAEGLPIAYLEASRCRVENDCQPNDRLFKLAVVTVRAGQSVAGIDMAFNSTGPKSFPLPASALAAQPVESNAPGAIMGNMPFATGTMPPMRVYAQNVQNEAFYYIADTSHSERAYKLLLPAGQYKVFAYQLDGNFAGWYMKEGQTLTVVTVQPGQRLTGIDLVRPEMGQTGQQEIPRRPKASRQPSDRSLRQLKLYRDPFAFWYDPSAWALVEENQASYYLLSPTISGCTLRHNLSVGEIGGYIVTTITGRVTFDVYLGQQFNPSDQRINLYLTRDGFPAERDGNNAAAEAEIDGMSRPAFTVIAPTEQWDACKEAVHAVLDTLHLDRERVQAE